MYVTNKRMCHTQALVLSHLGYCMVVWSSAANKDIKKLQLAQNRAARQALQCSFKTNVTKMHCSLAWLTVEAKINSTVGAQFLNPLAAAPPAQWYFRLARRTEVH